MKHENPSPRISYARQLFAGLLCLLIALGLFTTATAAPIRVVVWDEREAAQKTAYDGEFLGNTLAAYLAKQPGLTVSSVGLNDAEQGLSNDILDNCDVLIWWGHEKHGQVTPEHVKAVTDRIGQGRLSFIALHSAHWSKPFIGAMNQRAIEDALKTVPEGERAGLKIVQVAPPGGMAKRQGPFSPSSRRYKDAEGKDVLEITLPSCVFAVVAADGKPSHVSTMMPNHPIAEGVPAAFDIPQTEVYGGHFTVPPPDAVIFEEHWDNGETFTSGCAWQVGKGKVFYFRPGHEIYPIYKQEWPLKVVLNAIHWAAIKN